MCAGAWIGPTGTGLSGWSHPGAVYVSLEDELSDHTRPGLGRHPPPTAAVLRAAARQWGLRRGQPVVVYDDWNRAGSARAWWVLTAAGIDDVRILDGGLAAWLNAGGEVVSGPVEPPVGDVDIVHEDLYRGGRPVLTADGIRGKEVRRAARRPRSERFRGDVEPVDPVAGHIPGARNLPSTSCWAPTGGFCPTSASRR